VITEAWQCRGHRIQGQLAPGTILIARQANIINGQRKKGEIMSMMQEFKEFAMKGNVMDLAVGVIIGGAFGKIVEAVVADLIMPVVALIMGGKLDFSGNVSWCWARVPEGHR
jgi:hypothetical protein